jgi:GNAT superfamily N-acetyltransferase
MNEMSSNDVPVDCIDTNLFELIKHAASCAGRPCHEGQSFSYVALSPSPWVNAVFDVKLDGLETAKEIARSIVSGLLPNRVMLGPTSQPAGAANLLQAAGFVARPSARGMILDMARRRSLCLPEGCEMRFLATGDDRAPWSAVVSENLFDSPKETGGPAFAEIMAAMEGPRAFAAGIYVDGSPASTCFGFIDGSGVGGVYFVATEKAYRRRGYGAAAVSAVLEELAARRVEHCILHATALGESVYESLGFRGVCDLERYALGEAATAGRR